MTNKNRFQRLPGKRYYDTRTGETVSNSVKRRIQTGVSPGKFARLRRESGVKNPLGRYNRLVGLRVEQQQKEQQALVVALEHEKKSLPKNATKKQRADYDKLIKALREEKITRGSVKTSAEMKQILADLKTKSNAAKGRKAQALVELGLRDVSWTFAVGDSPGVNRGNMSVSST